MTTVSSDECYQLIDRISELLDHGEIEPTWQSVYDAVISAGNDDDDAQYVADLFAQMHDW